jgi:hypothetical protein
VMMFICLFRNLQQQPVWTSDVHLLFTDLQQTTSIVLKLPWTCNHVYLGNCTCTSVLLQSSAFTTTSPTRSIYKCCLPYDQKNSMLPYMLLNEQWIVCHINSHLKHD